MSKLKTLECHDCGGEIHIHDQYEDIKADELKFCPLCSSENVVVLEQDESESG
jgi:hypothetical protein